MEAAAEVVADAGNAGVHSAGTDVEARDTAGSRDNVRRNLLQAHRAGRSTAHEGRQVAELSLAGDMAAEQETRTARMDMVLDGRVQVPQQ